MRETPWSPLAYLRRWIKYPPTPRRPFKEGDKLGRRFKEVRNLFCNCYGCRELEYCHGLCKSHRNEKRRYGYRC